MKLEKKLKKFIASLIVTIILIGQLDGLRLVSQAATINSSEGDKLYIGLSALGDGIGYAINNPTNGGTGKYIWSMKSYQQKSESSTSVTASNLYCIKAGFGETWENQKNPNAVLEYTSSDFTETSVEAYYNELLWVIDHMYIPGEDNKAAFLDSIGIKSYIDQGDTLYYYEALEGYDYTTIAPVGDKEYTLTDDDVVAVQQAVIWYYTNYKVDTINDAIYNKLGNNSSWLNYTRNGNDYSELSDYNKQTTGEGPARAGFAAVLYNYLIDASAKEIEKLGAGNKYQLTNKTVKLWTSSTNGKAEQPIVEIHKKIKTGKYDLVLVKEDESGRQLNSQATFTVDGTAVTVIGSLTIKQNVQITSSNLTTPDVYEIQETKAPDNYCEFDGIITVTVTKKETADGYEVDEVTYRVKDSGGNDITSSTGNTVELNVENGTIYVKVKNYPEKSFDLALRKEIISITDSNGVSKNIENVKGDNASRVLTVDKSTLNNEDNDSTTDTATYKHRKDPVLVETNDIVEYALRIYNEGEQAGYAKVIVDQLPGTPTAGLRLISTEDVTSSTGNVYAVEYSTTTNTVTFTLKSSNPTTLAAYDGTTLSEEVISLKCAVMIKCDTKQAITLTNIAYIAEEHNSETNTDILNSGDRDSEPSAYPSYSGENDTKQDGITYGNDFGYIGSSNDINSTDDLSSNDKYYKGMQDDDDFEKLVILPKSFDLSLRKVITEVDGISTGNKRKIEITDLDKLAAGEKETAEYNHIKTPVIVKNGSVVTYNINIYNEGAIDGVATIIKDQLPTGLKLDLTSLKTRLVEGKTEYYLDSTKGNRYVVTYDDTTSIITFTLDTENTITNLEAFKNRTALDKDTMEFECIVECMADTSKNIYLTNIAYIYEEKTADGTVVTNQTGIDRDSEPYTKPSQEADDLKTVGNVGYTGNTENNANNLDEKIHFKGEQDDDDFEKVVVVPQQFDLKLIKYINQINGKNVPSRILNVDTSKLNTIGTDGKLITTAEYELNKNPLSVTAGDFVKYTFRVYNEGDYDGYATEISENIPEGLETFIITKDVGGNIVINTWDGNNLVDVTDEIKATNMYDDIVATNSVWGYNEGSNIIKTKALKDELLKAFGTDGYSYKDNVNNIDYEEISVILRVKKDIVKAFDNPPIRNEAAISEDKAVDSEGNQLSIEDRDSSPNIWSKKDSGKDYNEDGWEIYEEDDEDYDNIILREFDLSLRKQIVKIKRYDKEILYTGRFAKLDKTQNNTIYNYYNVYNNKPLIRVGDIITYSIRVYNEGEVDGYASLISDTIPEGLEFVPYTKGDGSINDEYGWKLLDGTDNVYVTDYLSFEKDNRSESTLLKAYSGTGEADFQEVEIQCRVKETATKQDSLLNVAQIAANSDENGKNIKDKDSTPGTTDIEDKWKVEDDLDIEILQLEEFDLSLRKFITEIEGETKDGNNTSKEIDTRIPEVSYDTTNNKLVYDHTKEPVIVHVGDTVIYTIRVYNEGEIDGYAQEVKDNMPKYLEYLPNHTINKEFNWKMYDKDGNETDEVAKAEFVKTNYLAKGEGAEEGLQKGDANYTANLIKAFNANSAISAKNPDYRDVKIAFKVNDPNSSEYIIENFAQIAEDADENGKPIKDIDSEPDNGKDIPKEDDEDIERVKVEYFDLALLKYVTKVIVTENGKEVITATGNVGDENDIVPKVEINKKKINSTVVKFAYTIKITNEGEIEGYATEITDYIPEGLKFIAEDNPTWKDEGNGVISTRALENVLLKPGESSEVEVILTWINGEDNLGAKVNVAEISEDKNDKNISDRDSTPDNKEPEEDDIDDAEVILSIKTGGGIDEIYTKLIIVLCTIILVGIVLIKKYVL